MSEGGWFRTYNFLIDRVGEEIGPYGIAIFVALARHANADGISWPSYARLAHETGMSRQKAIETVRYLESWNLIQKQPRSYKTDEGGVRDTSNLYKIADLSEWEKKYNFG